MTPLARAEGGAQGLDTDAQTAIVSELKSERSEIVRRLIEIDRELGQLGAAPRLDAFRSKVASYEIAILLDERLAECTDMTVREDVALSFDAAAKWMRKGGPLT